jgi:glycerophosphoryl diester phosphodiesterase
MNVKQSKPGTMIPGKRPFVIAHRGAALLAPENTIAAFDASSRANVDAIELDVRLTRDGHLVVIHDATVDRTTNGAGSVKSLTLEQIRRLDAGYRFSTDNGASYPYRGKGLNIPTLEEVLSRFPTQSFLVELKDSRSIAVETLSNVIGKHDAYDRIIVVLIGIKHRAAKQLRSLDARIKTSHTAREISSFLVLSRLHLTGLFKTRGLTFEVPMRKFRIKLPSKAFVQQAHSKGISVLVWTINDRNMMQKCIELGVDGIITDDTALLSQLIQKS